MKAISIRSFLGGSTLALCVTSIMIYVIAPQGAAFYAIGAASVVALATTIFYPKASEEERVRAGVRIGGVEEEGLALEMSPAAEEAARLIPTTEERQNSTPSPKLSTPSSDRNVLNPISEQRL